MNEVFIISIDCAACRCIFVRKGKFKSKVNTHSNEDKNCPFMKKCTLPDTNCLSGLPGVGDHIGGSCLVTTNVKLDFQWWQ